MKSAQQWFAEYAVSHQHPVNKLIHWFAVPVIYFTVFGLLWQIPMPFLALAEQGITWPLILCLPALAFYFSLAFSLGVAMTIFTALVVMLLRWFETNYQTPVWQISLLLFVIMWIFQFIGHKIEGKKPSFFKDVQFLLIGPAWLMGFILQRLGIKY
ncbi:DUF962 domain-containing protein [Chromatiaceae bacterium AAb-1]|nr:DUF962 domain-containing protein [Chromatiaceae bacterium AAb-1]